MRFIGLDVHKDFCEVAISEGGKARSAGRVKTTRAVLELFAQSLGRDDKVALEVTGNTLAIARILEPHVGEVVIANSRKMRAICEAKVKNDRVDARTLAELLAADLLPRVWTPDERTRLLRRLTSRRAQLVRHASRLKSHIYAALQRNPAGRMTRPEDVGEALVALASPRLYWMTGNTIGVDGGELMGARRTGS